MEDQNRTATTNLSISINHPTRTLTPLATETSDTFTVRVGSFGEASLAAQNVTLEIAPTPGLAYSGYDAIGESSRGFKTFYVTVTLTDTEVFPQGSAVINITGLNGMTEGFDYIDGTKTTTVSVIDGQAVDRAIAINNANFTAFKEYVNTTNGLKRHYKLSSDISLVGENNWNPIAANGNQFAGSFNGNGHIITDLNINEPDADMIGMFGMVRAGSIIKNVRLENANVIGGRETGGIVGHCEGTVKNCRVTGDVKGLSTVGGIVGNNVYGTINDCYTLCNVSSSGGAIGGVVGQNYDGIVQCSYSRSNVKGRGTVGGIVGGIVGKYAIIQSCVAVNDGLVTTGGFDYIGRISGVNGVGLKNNYALVTIKTSYYLTIHKDIYNSKAGMDGQNLSPSAITMQRTWIDAGFIFSDTQWKWDSSGHMPNLFGDDKCQWPKMNGSGTAEDPFWVYDAETLKKVLSEIDGWNQYVYYIQVAHIDMSGQELSQNMAANQFYGSYDGQLYSISNLMLNAPCYDAYGMFYAIAENGVVKNLVLLNVTVNSNNCSGGIVGTNYGKVLNCQVTGKVTGYDFAGGVVGYNNSKVENCCFEGSVNANRNVGGVVGFNRDGSISKCHAIGNVIADVYFAGGVVGCNSDKGIISKCSSKSDVTAQSYIGGIVGQNSGSINSCCTEGIITSIAKQGEVHNSIAGGVVGTQSENAETKNCYSTCYLNAQNIFVGGVAGYNYGAISFCFATGKVTGGQKIGGVVGVTYEQAPVESCVSLNEYISQLELYYSTVMRVVVPFKGCILANLYSRCDLPVFDGGRTNGITKSYCYAKETYKGDAQDVCSGTQADQYNNIAFWKGIGYDFNKTWIWDSSFAVPNNVLGAPRLREAGVATLFERYINTYEKIAVGQIRKEKYPDGKIPLTEDLPIKCCDPIEKEIYDE